MFLVSFWIYKMLPGAVRANARGKKLVALCLFVYLEHLRKWFLGASHTSFHRGLSKCSRKHITYWEADLVPSPAEQLHTPFSGHLFLHYSAHANTANEAVCCLLNKWMPRVLTCPRLQAVGYVSILGNLL